MLVNIALSPLISSSDRFSAMTYREFMNSNVMINGTDEEESKNYKFEEYQFPEIKPQQPAENRCSKLSFNINLPSKQAS